MALIWKQDTVQTHTSRCYFITFRFVEGQQLEIYFDGATGTTLFTLETPFSNGGTVPTNLLVLSPLDVVTDVLLLFNNGTLSFLTELLLPLFEVAVDMDAAKRVFDARDGALLPLPILFGRLELDGVSEKLSDLVPPLVLEPPLWCWWCKGAEFGSCDLLELVVDLRLPELDDTSRIKIYRETWFE